MNSLRGYGKVILFGEHAVVYGYPALAAGISRGIKATVQTCQESCDMLSIPSWEVDVCTSQDDDVLARVFSHLRSFFPAHGQNCRIVLHPEIPSRAGLGSSAATCVAIIRALLSWHDLDWPISKINELAYAGEQIFHGTPSGIDNTVACFGGVCYLRDAQRFPPPNGSAIELPLRKLSASLLSLAAGRELQLVVIDTRRDRETKEVVAAVRRLYDEDPTHYGEVMAKIGEVTMAGWQSLCAGDGKTIGRLMNENQEYLRILGVSSEEIEDICRIAREAGALGTKLTGAGAGGCVICYAPGTEQLVIERCEKAGYPAFIATVGK